MLQSFHNTIYISGPQLDLFEAQAKTQEDVILTVFRYAMKPLAWHEVRSLLVSEMNESSLKRSITNLCTKGYLVKDKSKLIQGPYGKPVHQYSLIK